MGPSKYLVLLVVCVFHGDCKPLDPQDVPSSQSTSTAEPVQPAVDPAISTIDPLFETAFQQSSNTAEQSRTTAAPSVTTPAPAMNPTTAPSVTNTTTLQPATPIPQNPNSVITSAPYQSFGKLIFDENED